MYYAAARAEQQQGAKGFEVHREGGLRIEPTESRNLNFFGYRAVAELCQVEIGTGFSASWG